MADHLLSGTEICKIIEACARRKVAKLEFGPLKLEFQPPVEHRPPLAPGPASPVLEPENVIREKQAQEHERALEAEEIRTREEQIAELQITDPLAAEELMQLEDDKGLGAQEELPDDEFTE